MNNRYYCPNCKTRYTSSEALKHSGLCPDCHAYLVHPRRANNVLDSDFVCPAPPVLLPYADTTQYETNDETPGPFQAQQIAELANATPLRIHEQQIPEAFQEHLVENAKNDVPDERDNGGNSNNNRDLYQSIHLDDSSETTKPENPDDIVCLQIVPIKGRETEIQAITQLYNALIGVAKPLCLEISGTEMKRYLIVRCKRKDAPSVKGQITGIYSAPEIFVIDRTEDPAAFFFDDTKVRGYTRLQLSRPPALPLRTYRELSENDTIMPILSALYGLVEGETALAQIVVHDVAPKNWAAKYKQELLALKRKQMGIVSFGRILQIIFIGISIIMGGSYFFIAQWFKYSWILLLSGLLLFLAIKMIGHSDIEWSESMEDAVMRKLQQPSYIAEVRIASAAATESRARELLRTLVGAFRVFSSEAGNSLEPIPPNKSPKYDPGDVQEHPASTMILGDEELATLWHLPVLAMPDMLPVSRVDDTLPDPSLIADASGYRIGIARKSAGNEFPVSLPRDAIKKTHTMIMGRTRMGKSTLLKTLFKELTAEPGRGVVMIDPHDDLIKDALGLVHPDRIDDVIYVNFADDELLPAMNVLDLGLYDNDPERAAAAFGEAAKSLYKIYWGPRMEVIFERTMMSLALANSTRARDQQFTILDAIALLTANSDSRLAFLKEVLPKDNAHTDTLIQYFRYEYEELTNTMREAVVMPVLSKLRPFESSSKLLSVFGQPASTFNPAKEIREGKIILVRTGAMSLSKEYSNFIGSLVLSMITRAIFAQSNYQPEERTPVTIIIDESQSFVGFDYPSALAQIAKFGGNIVLTTQGADFIGRSSASDEVDDPNAFAKIMSNIDTFVAYRTSGADAVKLTATEFIGEKEPRDLINLPKYNAFVRFNKDDNVVGPFRVIMDKTPNEDALVRASIIANRQNYLLPCEYALERARRSSKRIINFYGSAVAAQSAAFDGGGYTSSQPSPNVPDPYSQVDQILEEASLESEVSLAAREGGQAKGMLNKLKMVSASRQQTDRHQDQDNDRAEL